MSSSESNSNSNSNSNSKSVGAAFLGGIVAAGTLATGILSFSNYKLVDVKSIIYRIDLDKSYYEKGVVDKLYMSREILVEKYINKKEHEEILKGYVSKNTLSLGYTENSKVSEMLENYLSKEEVKEGFVSRVEYDEIKVKHDALYELVHGIPVPFESVSIDLLNLHSWYNEKLGVEMELEGWQESEDNGFSADLIIKLPFHKRPERIRVGKEMAPSFKSSFKVYDRDFEIKLVELEKLMFTIEEI